MWKKITEILFSEEDLSSHPFFKVMQDEMDKFHALGKHAIFCSPLTCGDFKRSHESGRHDLCHLSVCEDVQRSHETNHALCTSKDCPVPEIKKAHALSIHSEFCIPEFCPEVYRSHLINHALCHWKNCNDALEQDTKKQENLITLTDTLKDT